MNAAGTISDSPHGQPHDVWLVVDTAVDFQITWRLAKQPLHTVTHCSLGAQALHPLVVVRDLPGHIVLHLVKQETSPYNLGNGHRDLHVDN